jgi:hypothetical protein
VVNDDLDISIGNLLYMRTLLSAEGYVTVCLLVIISMSYESAIRSAYGLLSTQDLVLTSDTRKILLHMYKHRIRSTFQPFYISGVPVSIHVLHSHALIRHIAVHVSKASILNIMWFLHVSRRSQIRNSIVQTAHFL